MTEYTYQPDDDSDIGVSGGKDRDLRGWFFYQHAGYSYDPAVETEEQGHRRCARRLVIAEAQARELGWWVSIENDPDGPMEDDVGSVELVTSGECVCLQVTLYGPPDSGDGLNREPKVLGSLGDVVVPGRSDPYLQAVAAELALEAISERNTKTEQAPQTRREGIDMTENHDDYDDEQVYLSASEISLAAKEILWTAGPQEVYDDGVDVTAEHVVRIGGTWNYRHLTEAEAKVVLAEAVRLADRVSDLLGLDRFGKEVNDRHGADDV